MTNMEIDIMLIQMVQVKLVKGAYAMYYSEPFRPELHNNYLDQASVMAKPYLKEGWKVVHVMIIDHNF